LQVIASALTRRVRRRRRWGGSAASKTAGVAEGGRRFGAEFPRHARPIVRVKIGVLWRALLRVCEGCATSDIEPGKLKT